MLNNFKRGFTADYGIKIKFFKLKILWNWLAFCWCWLWPPEGTLDLNLINRFGEICMGLSGRSDHVPRYFFPWDPLQWLHYQPRPYWLQRFLSLKTSRQHPYQLPQRMKFCLWCHLLTSSNCQHHTLQGSRKTTFSCLFSGIYLDTMLTNLSRPSSSARLNNYMGMLTRLWAAGWLGRSPFQLCHWGKCHPRLQLWYQALIPDIHFLEEGESFHDFRELIKETFSIHSDLKDELLPNSDIEPFMNGSWSLQQ